MSNLHHATWVSTYRAEKPTAGWACVRKTAHVGNVARCHCSLRLRPNMTQGHSDTLTIWLPCHCLHRSGHTGIGRSVATAPPAKAGNHQYEGIPNNSATTQTNLPSCLILHNASNIAPHPKQPFCQHQAGCHSPEQQLTSAGDSLVCPGSENFFSFFTGAGFGLAGLLPVGVNDPFDFVGALAAGRFTVTFLDEEWGFSFFTAALGREEGFGAAFALAAGFFEIGVLATGSVQNTQGRPAVSNQCCNLQCQKKTHTQTYTKVPLYMRLSYRLPWTTEDPKTYVEVCHRHLSRFRRTWAVVYSDSVKAQPSGL